MNCIVYIRWSSAEQSKGSSLERQRQDCRSHAAANGWNVVDELIDDGVSAFKGKHASSGALGRFVRDVEAGLHIDGVVLLCEKLDRLSRQEPGRVFLWMLDLTEAGVTVATVEGNRRYSKGNFDMATIIEVVVKAQLGHEESEKKSQRLSAAWAGKRRRLEAGERFVMSRRAPAWLQVVGTPPRFQLLTDRALVVRRVFEETAAGQGKHLIAKNLNRDQIPTFGRADAWHASYVQKILCNPAVLGEFQPSRKPRGEKRETIGEMIGDYYPAVIDASLHARAISSMKERSRGFTGRGRRLVNLFSGLATCGTCSARMTFRSKGRRQRADGEWVQEDYLVCDSYQRGRGCDNGVHFNYAIWQAGVLDPIIFEALQDKDFISQADVQLAEIELASRERELNLARRKASSALAIAINTERHEARSAWLALTESADVMEADVGDLREHLLRLRGKVSPEEHRRRIEKLRSSLDHANEDIRFEARSKIMAAMHGIVCELKFHKEPRGVSMLIADDRIVYVHYDEMKRDTDWSMFHQQNGQF